jgi:Tfp pilus assembly protein PilO
LGPKSVPRSSIADSSNSSTAAKAAWYPRAKALNLLTDTRNQAQKAIGDLMLQLADTQDIDNLVAEVERLRAELAARGEP